MRSGAQEIPAAGCRADLYAGACRTRTFDWSLFELYNGGDISYDEAIRNADSANELRLNIKLNGTRAGSVAAAI